VIIFLFKPGTWSSKWHGLGLEVVWPWPRSGVALASKWHGLGLEVAWPWPQSGVALASKWCGLGLEVEWPCSGVALALEASGLVLKAPFALCVTTHGRTKV